MGWPTCNSTLEDLIISEDPIWHGHSFHDIGLWLGAIFTFIAVVVSCFLIMMHATHYLKPWEQRHIIRILFMVPVYAAVSLLSYYYYNHSIYLEVLGDCYEAFAIASFFSLLCAYLAPDLHQQKVYFRTIQPKAWVWPMRYFQSCTGGPEKGFLRTPRSGLTWFNVIWVCIFQYCFIRVFFTIVAVITEAFNLYCLESLSPAFSHVWIMVIESIAVSVAMYCLIQFYIQIRQDIRQHKPLLKITAIKLVIFLSFWQSTLISFLTSTGAIKATNTIQTPDIKVGIPALLLCIEMAIFSIFHLWAFSWKPYTHGSKECLSETVPGQETQALTYQGGFMGIKALWDAFNGWDMLKATGRGARWLVKGRKYRHADSSYDMTRKNTQSSDISVEGQKLSSFNEPTAYGGPPRPPHYSVGIGEEAHNLLAHGQNMPSSQPALVRRDSDRDDAPGYYDASDIGLATSSYNDKYAPRYQQPRPAPAAPTLQQPQSYSHPHYYAPYPGSEEQQQQQQTGVARVAPYPMSVRESSPQHRDPANRISMPHVPTVRGVPPGKEEEQNLGNFL